jgi:hypothetical protein
LASPKTPQKKKCYCRKIDIARDIVAKKCAIVAKADLVEEKSCSCNTEAFLHGGLKSEIKIAAFQEQHVAK